MFRDGKQIRKVHAVTAADGSFSRVFKGKRAGRYSVRVVSTGSAVLAARTGPKLTVGVYEPRASDGQSNALVGCSSAASRGCTTRSRPAAPTTPRPAAP